MVNSEEEIWKAHPEHTGIEVSTFGRVRTLDRVTSSEKWRILKQYDDGRGYLQASIPIDGKWTMKKVHRLVAQTFIPNPNGFPMVNHLDCNRKNNNVENLEFCTASYNRQYQEKFGKAKGLTVFAVCLATLEVLHFNSQAEASRALGVSHGNISNVISGRYNQTGGYWFVNDDGHAVDVVKSKLHDIGGTGLKIYN